MDFRKKLLVLSASAMAFAGVASAQGNLYPCGATDTGSANKTGLPNILRLEGTNDLATDLVVSCATGSTLAKGNVVVTLNANVTSTQIGGTNEATLLIMTTDTSTPTAYPGVVSGNQVTFGGSAGVTFPDTPYTIRVSNIRVNSSALASGTYVTEILNIYNQGVVAYSTSQTTPSVANGGVPINVGYVQQGFSVPTGTSSNYTLCRPNSDGVSFTVSLGEKFGGAFKTNNPTLNTLTGDTVLCGAGATTCTETNGEQGSYPFEVTGNKPGAAPAVGAANSGTRFIFSFSNIPSGVTVYMPVSVFGAQGPASDNESAAQLEMALTSSATGAFAAVPSSTAVAGYAALSSSNGTATAVYEVVDTDNTIPAETINISGIFAFAANFATSAVGPVSVTVTPGPTASANVPNFATSSNPPINLSSWTPCQTTLLFPFVTNQDSFDTGIVLSNTSTDPFGAAGASPSAGTCSLNFYGSGAPSPSTSVAAPGASQASGTVNAFVLSSVAPGFQGYMIAVCNYLYAHGYAFIEYDLTQSSGVAEGYLPLVVTDRNGGSKSLNEELNN